MNAGFSAGTARCSRWDAAALFGVALAQRCAAGDVVSFSGRATTTSHRRAGAGVPAAAGESLLRTLERWKDGGWFLGGGTDTARRAAAAYAGHDRVVIVTDEQAGHDAAEVSEAIPERSRSTRGTSRATGPGTPRPEAEPAHFGGLTDSAFRLIPLLEAGRDADWPWQDTAR